MPNGLALAITLLIVLIFLAYILSLVIGFFSPFYSTPKKYISDILSTFKLKKSDIFADLGCGDGRVIFAVNKMYDCKSEGYEISPMLLIVGKIRKLITKPFNSDIKIKEESFFNTNLSKYTAIYCCLPEDILENLEKKFEKELKKDCKVFTYRYKLPRKKGKEISIKGQKVYQYTY